MADTQRNNELMSSTNAPVNPRANGVNGSSSVVMTVDQALLLVRATTRPYPGAFWRQHNRVLRVWSAREHRSGSGNPVIALADGAIEAIEFDFEALHVTG